jgi:GMP synthase (glutamine-hydrolysing)
MIETILILDFGSQYSQLIARAVREAQVYAELLPWDASEETMAALAPKGFILSGGPQSIYETGSATIPDFVLASGLPILGICYGMQALMQALGGKVLPAEKREYGLAHLILEKPSRLLGESGGSQVWMSHGDRIEQAAPGFAVLASTENTPIAAVGNDAQRYYGLQFHPEVRHTIGGQELLRRFVIEVCGCAGDWTPSSMISLAVERIRAQVRNARVLSAVSGGVDSSVATALVREAVGDQLSAVFVDTGLMRQGEVDWVSRTFRQALGEGFVAIDAADEFFARLKGVTAPEEKRTIIGETFIRLFEGAATQLGSPKYLVQGTIYPDVVESRAPERGHAQRIKSHHNVGGLPEAMDFELVEPLRYLFKDEVRKVGKALGLPEALVHRQPFPGPGLAVRCVGEVTRERVAKLRQADAIFLEALGQAGLLDAGGRDLDKTQLPIAQAFAVLLPVRSVGVMGDQRTYDEVITLRAVTTEDFMTADWARLPQDLLAQVANRIVNQVSGINRVLYDITSKPPGTIEWE